MVDTLSSKNSGGCFADMVVLTLLGWILCHRTRFGKILCYHDSSSLPSWIFYNLNDVVSFSQILLFGGMGPLSLGDEFVLLLVFVAFFSSFLVFVVGCSCM